MKLYQRFAERGYHSSVVTTFGIDFDAYESIVLPRLRNAGCNNNLVIADSRMLTYALDSSDQLPRTAGRHYSVLGARSKGVFHPKVVLQLGRDAGRLIVSSANVTAPGLAGNLEVAGLVAASADRKAECRLLAAGWRYLERFLDQEQESVAHQVEWLRQRTPWLFEHEPAENAIEVATGERVALIDGNGRQSIASRFAAMVDGEKVRRLIVVSPYWDDDLRALGSLQKAMDAKEVSVLVGGSMVSFPSKRLAAMDGVRLYKMDWVAASRFMHAKIVIAQTSRADHVLYGSANCTVAALGSGRTVAGLNDEICLYRRMQPHGAIQELRLEGALSKGNQIPASKLPAWKVRPELPLDTAAARDPGRFELSGGQLLWWPSRAYAGVEALVELLRLDGSVLQTWAVDSMPSAGERRRWAVGELTSEPAFARVRVGKEVSAPSIVVLADVLRAAIREPRARQVEDVLSRFEAGDTPGLWVMDFIDLIVQAEAADVRREAGKTKPARTSGASTRKAATQDVRSGDTLSYEQFLAGRKLRVDHRAGARSAFVDSDLSFVTGYLNRLIGQPESASVPESLEADDEIRGALAIRDESQEEDDWVADSNDESETLQPTVPSERQRRDEAERRRRILAGRITTRDYLIGYPDEYRVALLQKATSQGLTIADVLRLRALLVVMIGSACPIGAGLLTSNANQVLHAGGHSSWPLLVGKILSAFFDGDEPAIGRLRLDAIHQTQPVELLECLATSFWAINVCLAAAESKKELVALANRLDTLSVQIYKRSGLTGDDFLGQRVIAILERMSDRFVLGIEHGRILAMHTERAKRVK